MLNETDTVWNGSITTPRGYRACGVRCGIKQQGLDLALLVSEIPASVTAMFTSNRIKAAPVILSQKLVQRGLAQALVINSGNANAMTGERGLADAKLMTELVGNALNLDPSLVLVASTGVIGHYLPMDLIRSGIAEASQRLSPTGGDEAAQAIMTTDTRPKHFAITFEINGQICHIGAIAKGSGMIHPQLATMIAVFTTDVAITSELLQAALAEVVAETLNALTIDGETSTNDSVFMFANGLSGSPIIDSRGENYQKFLSALRAISMAITKELAADGEGATKLVSVTVLKAATRTEAFRAAKAIANSLLVKTAIFGQDPNWGRVISAVGASGVILVPDQITIKFADIPVAQNGAAIAFDRAAMKKALQQPEISISVALGAGEASATVYTCDLTYDYIKINAEYHT
ncbi:MAG: bifunctional glutamate N-acetyltransferase/amino-acid acetyltransferase ArgJ [candidate division KSB1 bacterium]|nr:bifunctional glutamate N-acetyltransferase/amino-acid acetyltransferase ArgJ [candidate division KSB1 bacterium]MDZ7333937.1 bifunctional glutamate N-acetyltransferase/amino-acid acetyltransferase ArgJ [candidate division KSB1 bacterium]MDZ7358524.1 bifunctional glutamate N-acetyltransferase/amino-acid acetyltransferase ArgJ [candidate division KSB1 bacterium]MDZ7375164.1 bifunctional glutamate N-acetyltransferase/amino-acid acetyltransferase ArgJ [candidate division KSB1 bacterium]MDZ739918